MAREDGKSLLEQDGTSKGPMDYIGMGIGGCEATGTSVKLLHDKEGCKILRSNGLGDNKEDNLTGEVGESLTVWLVD